MSNDYYNHATYPAISSAGSSRPARQEFDALATGLDRLPSLAQFRSGNVTGATVGGTANALTVTHPFGTWTTYVGKNKYRLCLEIVTANTGAVTLAVDLLTAKSVVRVDGQPLQADDLPAGSFIDVIFDESADKFVALNVVAGFITEAEDLLSQCQDQVTLATALTGFLGLWSAQTGAKTLPCSVYHLGSFWALTSAIADITAKVPGTAPEWVLVDRGISYGGLSGALNAPAVCIHGGYFWNLITNSADITLDVPGVSAKWEKVDKLVYNPVVNYQEFTGSGTWTKPPGNYKFGYAEAVGGGGSGAKYTSNRAGGGGGGEFACRMFLLSDAGATETVTIGAGGVAVSTNNTDGNDGGTSSFGSLLSARGGYGGAKGADVPGTVLNRGAGGDGTRIGGGYGCGSGATSMTYGASEIEYPAGHCTMGGAGGGSGFVTTTAGTSQRGGNGGNGSAGASSTAGSQPGGGGGGHTGSNNSGAGGAGRVRVWVW